MIKKIDISDSELEENFKSAQDITEVKMAELLKTEKIGTICRVIEKDLSPFILIESADGKTWIPYRGENVAELNKLLEWEEAGRKEFNDHERSFEDLDQLRLMLVSVANIHHFLNDEEVGKFLLQQIVSRTAELWYNKDKNTTIDLDVEVPEDFPPYLHIVSGYVKKIEDYFTAVRDNTHVAAVHMKSVAEQQEAK